MKLKSQKKIQPGKEYRLTHKSKYFADKYGIDNPLIIVEDTDERVFGDKWQNRKNVPAVLSFILRMVVDDLTKDAYGKDKAYYGKIYPNGRESFGIGELVFASELN